MATLHMFGWERNLSSLAYFMSHYYVRVEVLEMQASLLIFIGTVKI